MYKPKEEIKEEGKSTDHKEESKDSLQAMVSQIRHVLLNYISKDMIRMTRTQTEIRLRLDERILFARGSSKLHNSAMDLISSIAQALQGQRVNIIVEGHADSDGASEEVNWKLSSERAVAVVTAMRSRRDQLSGEFLIDGRYLQARARGQFWPMELTDGASDWNRRVEIIIQSRNASAQRAVNSVQEMIEQNY